MIIIIIANRVFIMLHVTFNNLRHIIWMYIFCNKKKSNVLLELSSGFWSMEGRSNLIKHFKFPSRNFKSITLMTSVHTCSAQSRNFANIDCFVIWIICDFCKTILPYQSLAYMSQLKSLSQLNSLHLKDIHKHVNDYKINQLPWRKY